MPKILLIISALLLLVSTPLQAAEHVDFQHNKPSTSSKQNTGLQAAKRVEHFQQGLFWSISKDGEQVGHIFGTLHTNDARVTQIAKPVKTALLKADNFCIETFPGVRYFSPNSGFKSIIDDMMLAHGERLENLVGTQTYQQIRTKLIANGLKEERIARLKPWAAMHTLSGIYRTDVKHPSGQGRILLDHLLYNIARDNSATLYQLETLEELMAAYYAFPIDAQVALLKDRVENLDQLPKIAEGMIRAYLKEDLSAMLDLATDFISDSSAQKGYIQTYLKHVLYIRNIVMAHYMLAPLRRKSTFISMGALHLYGDGGVLSLLEKYGYQVKRVSINPVRSVTKGVSRTK